jgi:hypothetical protein
LSKEVKNDPQPTGALIMNFDFTNDNIGNIDRLVRGIVGVLLLVIAFLGNLWVALAVLIGAVLLGTAYFRFCPAYTIFNFSSNKYASLVGTLDTAPPTD